MKSFAVARVGMLTIVGALTWAMLIAMPATPASAQEQPPADSDQARGEVALAAARQAMEEGRWAAAVAHWEDALTYLPGNEEALDGLQDAQTMLNQAPTSGDVAQDIQVMRERTLAEFDASYDLAEERLQQQDFEGAAREIVQAQVTLDSRRDVLSESQYRQLTQRANELQARIDREREAWELAEQQRINEEARIAQELAAEEAREERQRIIDENFKRARALQMELKYDEALQVLDEILFMDPLNAPAQAMTELIRTTMLYREYQDIQSLKEFRISGLSIGAQRQLVPPAANLSGPGPKSTTGIMEYPVDWPQLTIRRGGDGGFQESAADQMVRQKLETVRVPVDFNGNSFAQVMDYFQDVTGVTIYTDYKALNNIGIDPDDEITLKLSEVNVATALERVLEQVGDGDDQPQFAVQDGILTVSSDEALRARTLLLVYDIRDLLFQVPVFDNAPTLDLDAALNQGVQGGGGGGSGGGGGGFGGGGGGGSSGGGGGSGGSLFEEGGPEPERVSREQLVEQIVNILQENVDPDGWRDMGGDTGSLQELNGNLIITNTPNNHRDIHGLLSQLREIRALQINVESRFLTVANDWFEKIGVDLDLYFKTNDDHFNAMRAADPNAHLSDAFFPDGTLKDPIIYGNPEDVIAGNANTVPSGTFFGLPNGTITNNFEGIDYSVGPVGAPVRATDGFAPIGVNQQHNDLITQLAEFDAASFAGIANANPALAVGIQFLDDIQVDLLIEATQADRRSVILTAPRLTFFNGQRSWVAVTTQQAFVSALTAVTGDASGAFQPTIATLQDGFVLDVEAVISADRRYVTLTVLFDFAEFLGFRESSAAEFSGGAGGGGTGGGDAAQFTGQVELPILRVSQIRTTVSVPDKGTVLLGGQRQVREVEVEAGVPVLSKIPWINRFFTNRVTSKEEQTLLILIRPEVIIQQENEQILFPGLSDSIGGAGAYLR